MAEEPTNTNPTPTSDVASALTEGRVSPEDYKTRGTVTVAARPGYEVIPTDKSLPVVTTAGVTMTRDQADALLKESPEYVTEVEKDKE